MKNYIKFRDKVLKIIPLPIKQILKIVLVRWLKLGKIIFPDRKWLPGWTTQMKVISSLFIVAIISIVYYLFQSNFDFAGAALNFGTEMLGVVITYLLIQYVIGKSETKEKLINPSCYLEGIERSSDDKESDLEFKATRSNSMDVLGQQAFDQTASGFDDFSTTGQQIGQPGR